MRCLCSSRIPAPDKHHAYIELHFGQQSAGRSSGKQNRSQNSVGRMHMTDDTVTNCCITRCTRQDTHVEPTKWSEMVVGIARRQQGQSYLCQVALKKCRVQCGTRADAATARRIPMRGESLLRPNQFSMNERSYVTPSAATTGSSIRS